MLVRYIVSRASKIKSILSIIFHAIYGAVRIELTHFSYDDFENMCTLSYLSFNDIFWQEFNDV